MNPTRTVVSLALAALCAHACAVPIDPRAPSPAAGPSELHFELSAHDARGRAVPLEGVARRPEFVLSSARPLLPVELVLLAGEPDADLLDDLASLPLRAASARRVVPSYAVQVGSVLRLAPRITLAKDAAYTLALPGTARTRDGVALGDGGPAFVALLRTAREATAGAAWLASIPAAGQRAVPVNLESAFVALDGKLEEGSNLEEALWLEGPAGTALPARTERVDCEALEGRAVTCARLTLGGELEPAARYAVRSGRALRDARGAPVEPLMAAFETAPAADRRPPEFEPVGCLPDEREEAFGCLVTGDTWVELALRSDESVRVAVRSDESSSDAGDDPQNDAGLGREGADLDGADERARHGRLGASQLAAAGGATLRVDGFAPASPFSLTLTATDLAGNFTDARVTGATVARLATLSITEVLADPEGADANQEYVEIWNFDRAPVELRGISLADASGKTSVVTHAAELTPNARALLVADSFTSQAQPSAAQPAVPAGVRLVRVGASLTKSGIANAGEALYLRDAAGHRLSAAPAHAAAAGLCLQRVGFELRSGASEDFAEARCSPGR